MPATTSHLRSRLAALIALLSVAWWMVSGVAVAAEAGALRGAGDAFAATALASAPADHAEAAAPESDDPEGLAVEFGEPGEELEGASAPPRPSRAWPAIGRAAAFVAVGHGRGARVTAAWRERGIREARGPPRG